ncbi:MAG: transcription antitermination factor NusB [Myxococcota bacterium]
MTEKGRSSRHRSREVALQALYAVDIASRSGDAPAAQEVFDRVAANFEMPEAARAFAKELVCGCCERRERIDAIIAEHSRNWRLSRMAVVDRNILRLVTFELLELDTPSPVVIDEAVELARRFGSDTSPSFVNGIADAVSRTLSAERRSAGREART